ncbi:MAG: BadF/BadG/BcrA/BcrD ATPase family protein [Actinomycetota bacterium]|nr:BadF/BadG/BcrA/BcrD ATPase family protein [Actinomycetota bacterium]
MQYILGVDGGGTKTTARIADTDGNSLAQGVSGASNYHSVGIPKAIENLNQAISEALSGLNNDQVNFVSSCFGFAGFNAESDRVSYQKIVFNSILEKMLNPDKALIYNDTMVGLAAGSDCPNKIILIAGTGSNCYGISQQGRDAKANGWDYILADEGSGYSMGLNALRAIMRAYDGRGPSTQLIDIILKYLNIDTIDDLIKWTYQKPFSKDRIGIYPNRFVMRRIMETR